MEALVVPTQEHLYQFVEAMCGGAYGRYFGETRVGWTENTRLIIPSRTG